MWHMYGLTKIFELRGPSQIRCDIQPDRNLVMSCLTLSVSSRDKGKTHKQKTAQKLITTRHKTNTYTRLERVMAETFRAFGPRNNGEMS